jgi:hypothetical protein
MAAAVSALLIAPAPVGVLSAFMLPSFLKAQRADAYRRYQLVMEPMQVLLGVAYSP